MTLPSGRGSKLKLITSGRPMEQSRLERKLAAVFYADVVGYSRLTGEDEEGTHRRLSTCLDVMTAAIEAHDGRVVHFAGDAVLADFGSIVRALDCAVEVQRDSKINNADLPADRRLEFRIGINLGDVLVDRGDIYGDGVNVAARLEALADPGGIAISANVHHQIRRRTDLHFDFLGDQQVKNIADPVAAYRVLLDSDMSPPRLNPMVTAPSKRRFSPLRLAGGGLLAVFLVLLVIAAMEGPSAVRGDRSPTVVVIPFRLIGDAQVDNKIRAGLMEDLTTALSRDQSLRVIAASSPERAARGANYRLEGSLRRVGRGLRITAQLIDPVTGLSLWGWRYDRTVAALLAVQADVAKHIVTTMSARIRQHEAKRNEGRDATGSARVVMEFVDRMGGQLASLPGLLMRGVFGEKNTHGSVD